MCAWPCLTVFHPMDYISLGSSVHGIFQTRILEQFATSLSRGSSWPRDRTPISYVFCTGSKILYQEHHLGSPWTCMKERVKVVQSCPTLCDPKDLDHGILQARILEQVAFPFSRGVSQPRDQSPTLQVESLPAEPQGKPRQPWVFILSPSLYCFVGFAFSGKSYSWEHTV